MVFYVSQHTAGQHAGRSLQLLSWAIALPLTAPLTAPLTPPLAQQHSHCLLGSCLCCKHSQALLAACADRLNREAALLRAQLFSCHHSHRSCIGLPLSAAHHPQAALAARAYRMTREAALLRAQLAMARNQPTVWPTEGPDQL